MKSTIFLFFRSGPHSSKAPGIVFLKAEDQKIKKEKGKVLLHLSLWGVDPTELIYGIQTSSKVIFLGVAKSEKGGGACRNMCRKVDDDFSTQRMVKGEAKNAFCPVLFSMDLMRMFVNCGCLTL